MMDSKVDELLEKLNTHIVDNDKEILNCLIELDDRLKEVETRLKLIQASSELRQGIDDLIFKYELNIGLYPIILIYEALGWIKRKIH